MLRKKEKEKEKEKEMCVGGCKILAVNYVF
jgi:hypothetical protein